MILKQLIVGESRTAAKAAPGVVRRSVFERYYLWCAVALLAAMAAAQFASARLDSQVVDESYHITAGYVFLRTGDLNRDTEHPPLAQSLFALPLLWMHLRLPAPAGPRYIEEQREIDFLYHNTASPDRILLAARCGNILLTLLLGVVLAWWSRRHFGAGASLAALAMFAFDPNFIAHGHFATTDVGAALGFFTACLSWSAFLRTGQRSRAALCGVATGLALAIKYSAVLLFPVFVYLYCFAWWHQTGNRGFPPFQHSLRHLAEHLVIVAAAVLPVVFAAFGFQTGAIFPPGAGSAPDWMGMPYSVRWAAEHLPVAAPGFFHGLFILTRHDLGGHLSYLMGQTSSTGWWYYFPVVLAVKTPTGVLLLFLLAAAAAVLAVFKGGIRAAFTKLRELGPEWHVLTVPPLFYLLMGMRSHIDIGIRHMLPVYPFLFVWVAAVLFVPRGLPWKRLFSRAAVVCLALTAVESAAAFPRYLAFFNLPSGGRSYGWHYVADSNLDWGQDLKRLRAYVADRGISSVCLGSYVITSDEYLGFPLKPLPASLEQALASGCVVAASITHVVEWPLHGRSYEWMAYTPPTGSVADSFWIYDPRLIGGPR